MNGYYVDHKNLGWGFHVGDHNGSDNYGMLYYVSRQGNPTWCTMQRIAPNAFGLTAVTAVGLPGSTQITSEESCGTLILTPVEGQYETYDAELLLNANAPFMGEMAGSPPTPIPYRHRFVASLLVPRVDAPDPAA